MSAPPTEGVTQCKCRIRTPGLRFYKPKFCSRAAVKDGYCKQHHPDSKKARAEANSIAYRAKLDNTPLALAYRQIAELKLRIAQLESSPEPPGDKSGGDYLDEVDRRRGGDEPGGDDARDAARYRFLRSRRIHWPRYSEAAHDRWVAQGNTQGALAVDEAIDAERLSLTKAESR